MKYTNLIHLETSFEFFLNYIDNLQLKNQSYGKYKVLSHDWHNSRLLIGQLAYDMKLY